MGTGYGHIARDGPDSFLEAVGPSERSCCHCSNFDFCEGIPFDIRRTPSAWGPDGSRAVIQVPFEPAIRLFLCAIGAKPRGFRGSILQRIREDSPFALLREWTARSPSWTWQTRQRNLLSPTSKKCTRSPTGITDIFRQL